MKYPHPEPIHVISVLPDYVNSRDCLSVYFNSGFIRLVFSVDEALAIIRRHIWAGYRLIIVWNERED